MGMNVFVPGEPLVIFGFVGIWIVQYNVDLSFWVITHNDVHKFQKLFCGDGA
jgi:hypothetical protein